MTRRRGTGSLLAICATVTICATAAVCAAMLTGCDAGDRAGLASFVRDTWVETEDGPRRIEEISVGDAVYAYDVATEEWALHGVLEVIPSYYDQTMMAWFSIGSETIGASAHHPVYVVSGEELSGRLLSTPRSSRRRNNEGWVRAGDLRTGDVVITIDGEESRIDSVYLDWSSSLLFDLRIAGAPNFAAGATRLLVADQTLVPDEPFAVATPEYTGGGGCFPAGVVVNTETGPIPIQQIEPGTLVDVFDVSNQVWTMQSVSQIHERTYTGEFVTIRTVGGALESTSNHPILVRSGANLNARPAPADVPPGERETSGAGRWIEAGDVRVGDTLVTAGGSAVAVLDIQSSTRSELVYNITVEPAHTYLVGPSSIVVHNKGEAEMESSGGYPEEGAFSEMAAEPSQSIAADDLQSSAATSQQVGEPSPVGESSPLADPARDGTTDGENVRDMSIPDQLFLSTDDSNSTASPAIVRSIIESGRYVPPSIVRTYEFYNYYSFGYPGANEGELGIFANLHDDVDGAYSVQAVLRGPDRTLEDLPPLNVVFLMDVSGSMAGESWKIAREFVYQFIEYLRPGDTIAMVTVSRYADTLIDQYQVNAGTANYVRNRLDEIVPNDITNLDPGIATAYEIAGRFQRYRGLTRVILISDGGANAGDFSGNTISRFAEDAEQQGVYLTGVGVGNGYSDGLMDSLTDSGRGAYFFLDSTEEISSILGHFVSYFDLAYKDVRLGMQMPSGWSVKAFHGEQISTVREDIVPQYLAPSDQMIFHMELQYAGGPIRPGDEFTFEAEYTPIGETPRLASRTFTVAQMSALSNQLVKANGITAFAEGLKKISYPLMENRIENMRVWEAVLAEMEAALQIVGDDELEQLLTLAKAYAIIVAEGEQFPASLDRVRTDIPALLGLQDETVRSVTVVGPETEAAIQERTRLRESILLQPTEGYRFLALSSGPVGNPYPVGSGQLSGAQFRHPEMSFLGNARYYMNLSPVYDRHQVVLELQAPRDAQSFSFDFNFFSAEYPDFINQSFNDSFYAILQAQSTNDGKRTNISFDPDQNPIEVDNNYFQRRFHPIPNTGTGFDVNGSTGWLRTSWPISGGERFTLTFTVHDEGDAIYDSMALLDNFQWHAYPAAGNTDPMN